MLQVALAVTLVLAAMTDAAAQKYTGSPVTKARLLKVVESKQFSVPIIVKQIKASGTDFEVTPAVESELVAVRANTQIIQAARENYRYRGQAGTRRPPVTVERDTAGENYDRLFWQGVDTLKLLPTATSIPQATSMAQSVINIGNQAIKANPARPEAYTLVCGGNLVLRSFSESQRYCQMALDRGGNLMFPVWHLAGQPHIEMLYIGQGFVTIESNQEFFQFNGREITSLTPENDYVVNGVRAAVFKMQTYKNGRSDAWYFTPGTTWTTQESQMIMQLIDKNSMK